MPPVPTPPVVSSAWYDNPAWFSAAIALTALAVSLYTLWSTKRRGEVKVTQPTVVYFGPDGSEARPPKVYVVATLYNTATRGRMLEHLYLKVSRRDAAQVFSIWVHGDKGDLGRGGGIFVPHDGVTTTHHFLCGDGAKTFRFAQGDYTVELFGQLVGQARPHRLWKQENLRVSADDAKAVEAGAGIHFDWSSEAAAYESRVFDAGRALPGDPLQLLQRLLPAPPKPDEALTYDERNRLKIIDEAYRRGGFFSIHLADESHIDRDGSFSFRLVLCNASPFRPKLGAVLARQIHIDGRGVSAGAADAVIEAPLAVGDEFGEQPVYVRITGKTKEPIPEGRRAVGFHLGGLQITPRDGDTSWPQPAKLRDVSGCIGVGEK